MADAVERVEYSFEGDTSSLKSATDLALSLLKKYSKVVEEASTKDGFKVSKRSASSMSSTVSRLTKDVEKVQGKLQVAGNIQLPSWSNAYKGFDSVVNTLTRGIKNVSTASKISTKDFNAIRTSLNGARGTMTGASQSVDRLVASEQRFNSINNTLKQSSERVRNTLSTAFEPVKRSLSSVSTVLQPIVSKVQSFKDIAQNAFKRVGTLAQTCASAFRRVSKTSDDVANGSKKVVQNTDKQTRSTKNVSKETNKASQSGGSFATVLGSLASKLQQVSNHSKKAHTSFKALSSVSNGLKSVFQALVGVSIGDTLFQGTKAAIDYVESLNLFQVAMGDSIELGRDFVAQMQELYGIDPKSLYDTAGLFYQLSDAIGSTDKASAAMSLSLTKATNDLASLFNKDFETVAQDLFSGIQGMTRAVRKYGLDIRVATLQQTAFKYGLTEQVASMSEANRQALRTLTMLEQMSNATKQMGTDANGNAAIMGDFARTIEQPANQLRILKEQMAQLGRAIGNFFVVPIKKAIAYVNGFVMALRMAINFVGSLLGIIQETGESVDTADDLADSVSGIGSAAAGAAKKVKQLTAPFDELNVLQQESAEGSGGGGGMSAGEFLDPALEQALQDASLGLENIRMKANDVRDAILGFFGFKYDKEGLLSWDADQFEKNLINKFPQWTQTIQAVFDNWSSIFSSFKKVLNSLGGVFDLVIGKIKNFIGQFVNDDSVSSWIDNLSGSLDNLSSWIDDNSNTLANLTLGLGGVAVAFKLLSPVAGIIGTVVSGVSKLVEFLAPLCSSLGITWAGFFKVFGIVGLVAGALALLTTQSETFKGALVGFASGLWTNLQTPLASLQNTFNVLREDISSLWTDSLQPLVVNIGEFLAPVLNSLGTIVSYLIVIFDSVINSVTNMWHLYVKPTLEETSKAIRRVVDILKDVWEDTVGPILERIGSVLTDLWLNYIQPIVEDITAVIHNIGLVLLGLWNNVLYPIVKWLWGTLAPIVNWVIDFIVGLVQWLVKIISTVVKAITGILKGITDFLAGVFTGDWKKALSGLVNIFVAIGNLIIGIAEGLVNAIILVLNTLWGAIYAAVAAIVNSIGSLIEGIAEVLGFDLEVSLSAKAPLIPDLHIPRIPEVAFARGGVVTGPTRALIGEGAYDEAVIPLGNSPQMAELVNRIADAVEQRDPEPKGETIVKVYIGDKEWDAFTYKSAQRGKSLVGAQPIKEGR